ncbi:MAG: metallopeptidase TldD-related protein [Bacilli bacterium]
MIERIIKALKNNPKVNAWRILETKSKSSELFFVSKRLETTRATDLDAFKVTVYTDFDGFRGSATMPVETYMSDADLKGVVEEALYRASFVKDKYYDLVAPVSAKLVNIKSNMEEHSLQECANIVADAVFKADNVDKGSLSATEIFVYDKEYRVVNSCGVDYSFHKYSGMLEFIPNWVGEKEEVELYRNIRFGAIDPADITARVSEALVAAKDRSIAVHLPKEVKKCKVLLAGNDVGQLFSFFVSQLDYATVFQQMSLFKLGESCQGDKVLGDKINITLTPYVAECVASRPVDTDGVVLHEIKLIDKGIPLQYAGASRWGQYLGVKEPTGSLPLIVVAPGSKSIAEMEKEPYIECVAYSGLQVDPFSDYIGGEVRLGYYFDGKKRYPITGFSIGGSLKEAIKNMHLSKETRKDARMVHPTHVEIEGMDII